jgi:hypothetical protein
MHRNGATDKTYRTAEPRVIYRSVIVQDCEHSFQQLSCLPPMRVFSSLTMRDYLPRSTSQRVSSRLNASRTEMCHRFADILHDGGLNTSTHLYQRED